MVLTEVSSRTCKKVPTNVCYKKRHVGTCIKCNDTADYEYGCKKCGARREDLDSKPPKVADEAPNEEDKEEENKTKKPKNTKADPYLNRKFKNR